MSDMTTIVECGRVEDFSIDECEFCHSPVLRPKDVPSHATPICRQCLPGVMAAAAVVGSKVEHLNLPH
jgi:hypothetical protein